MILGIDGATWKIINPMIDSGELPNLARIKDTGSWGVLHSSSKIASPTLWTTIATGKSPSKHGIEGFFIETKNGAIPYKSYHRKQKALWNIVSEHNQKASIINYPASHPAEAVNGTIISEYPYSSYPPSLLDETKKIHINNPEEGKYPDEEIRSYHHALLRFDAISDYMFQNYPSDLFCIYLKYCDDIQHKYWKFMEPSEFDYSLWNLSEKAIKTFKHTIRDYYKAIDNTLVGNLLRRCHGDTQLLIISDHGARKIRNPIGIANIKLNIYKILEKAGMLKFKRDPNIIDYKNSKCYLFSSYPGHAQIRINTTYKRRLDKNKLSKKIIRLFSSIKLASTGEKYFEEPYKGDDNSVIIKERDKFIKSRPYKKNIDVAISDKKIPIDSLFEFRDVSGTHDGEDGIILMLGNAIKKSKIANATLFDIAPTSLYLMGLPTAKDMPGKILKSAIKKSFLKSNPLNHVATFENHKKTTAITNGGPSYYDKVLIERLKRLGYI